MWKDLNIALKSLLMSIFLRNGIDNINQMKSMYNQFQNGGPKVKNIDNNRFDTGGPTEKQRRALATQYFWENKMDKARQYAVPSVYEGGQLPEIKVFPERNQGEITPVTGNALTRAVNNYIGELKYDLKNNKVPSGKYTLPAALLGATGLAGLAKAGEMAYTTGATPLIIEGMNVPFTASGLDNLYHGDADWQTALEIAPLASYARPMWNAGKAIYNAGKTALYNNVDKLPWVYNIPENERMAYRIMSPAEKQWLLQGNELSTSATNPTALKNARAAVEAERAANPKKVILFKAGAEYGGRKQFAKGQPWGGTTTTFGEKQILAIPGENLPWVSGRHYLGPQGRGFKVGPVSFDDAPFGTHIDLQTNEAGFSGVNPSQLEGSVIYSPFKLFGKNFGYRVTPVKKALGGNLFADGGILGDVTRGMKVDTDQCATWSNRLLRNNGYLISGNAWNLNDVDTLFNGFAGLLKPLTYNRKDVEAYNHMASDNVYKNFDSNTLDKTKPYVVNMFYNNSPALKDAYNDGRNVTGTHTGLLTYDESKKKWIVTHNIHGKIHQENFVPLLSGKGKYGVTAIYQPREDNIFNRVRGFLGFSDGGFINYDNEFDRVMRPLNEYRLR